MTIPPSGWIATALAISAPAEIDRLLAVAGKRRVRGAVGVQSRDREVATAAAGRRADEHELPVGLRDHRVHRLGAAEVDVRGAGAARERPVDGSVRVQPLGDEVLRGAAVAGHDDPSVGLHDDAAADVVHPGGGPESDVPGRVQRCVRRPCRGEPRDRVIAAASRIGRAHDDESSVGHDDHVRGSIGSPEVEGLLTAGAERRVQIAQVRLGDRPAEQREGHRHDPHRAPTAQCPAPHSCPHATTLRGGGATCVWVIP